MQVSLVVCYSHLNAFATARLRFEEARQLIEPRVEPVEHARLMRKAVLFYESELAVPILLESAVLLKRYRVDHETIMTLNNLATEYIALGKLDRAADVLGEAIGSSVAFDSFRLDYLLCNRGIVSFLSQQLDSAMQDFHEAFRYASRGVTKLIIQNNIAVTLLALRRTASAVDLLRVLLAEANMVGEHVYITSITLNLARCHFVTGRPLDALLLLATAKVMQLNALSSSYKDERTMLLRSFLGGMSCIANGDETFASASERVRQTPHLIDMQFWGD
jgi:tetratricopeptide (TPR) repeat protein